LRKRNRQARALVVDPASQHVLQRLRAAAIRNVGDLNTDRGVEQKTAEVIRAADTRRPELEPILVCLRVGYEPPQVIRWKILACEQQERLVDDETDGREIACCVVERLSVNRLVLRMGADIAEHELIAVGSRLGDPT